ncbi:MAG: GH92 family glycosyl hydrolase [Clostridia bacterium]|nr:GH92 family glycosyl hydrolase [Clostridia bacterium]
MSTQPLYFTSFEPIPTDEESAAGTSLPEIFPIQRSEGISALTVTVSGGPARNRGGLCANCGWTGAHAALLRGTHTVSGAASACAVLADGLSVTITPGIHLSYLIFPDCATPDTDFSYTSHYVAVDLAFSDGTHLSELSLPDQNGHTVSARAQGQTRSLFTREWNYIEVDLSAAAGKTVSAVLLTYDKPEGQGEIFTYVDDIKLAACQSRISQSPADDVLITRGTMNSDKSRGLMFPAVCVPNGFNFWAPASYTHRFFYDYQESSLVDFRISHQSSYHLLDHGVLQFMPNVTATAAEDAQLNESARRSHFSHENEIAHAHEYAVTFDEDSPAGTSRVQITPTDHAAVIRITFPPFAERRNIIFDCHNTSGLINTKGTLSFSGCSFRAVVDYHFSQLDAGDTLMYVYGEFDCRPENAATVPGPRPYGMVQFAPGNDCVTMRIATSYISTEQARRNLHLEVGDASYEEIRDRAMRLWNDLLGVIEIGEGATEQQRITMRSSQYRMYAYPTNYSENIGTAESPNIVYASPYQSTNERPVTVQGQMYTSNGFWDTYRTAWTAYALLTPHRATTLLEGILQHYRETGWVGRWLTPAAANCMVGTSYDIIFADALARGVNFNTEQAWGASVRSAACPMQRCFGRAGGHTAPLLGYTPNGICWTLENATSDAAISRMARTLGKRDEAIYYANRALFYVNVFDRALDFFVQRDSNGEFVANEENFCPMKWDYGYVETNAWGTAFSVTHDVQGLTTLYGGREATIRKLDALFSAPARHYRDNGTWQHEMIEAQDIRLGQYQHSNQPSHHICYLYNYLGQPYKTQWLTRDVLDRLYVGSPIGQGVYGDEDNGEQSAWYVLSALGFYPMNTGTDEYCITSPLLPEVTLHLPTGDLHIRAVDNSSRNVYIQRMEIDGKPYNRCFITHGALTAAREIVFYMGDHPSDFGTGTDSLPSSWTRGALQPVPATDLVDKASITADTDITALHDNSTISELCVEGGKLTVTYRFADPMTVQILTVACGKEPAAAPDALHLEVSADPEGDVWQTLDCREGLRYEFPNMIKPYAPIAPAPYYRYRLTLTRADATPMAIGEVELIGK